MPIYCLFHTRNKMKNIFLYFFSTQNSPSLLFHLQCINAWNISFQNLLRWFINLYHILDGDQLVSLFILELKVYMDLSSASFNKYTLPCWGFVFSHLQRSRFEGHWVPLSASNWWYSNEIWSRCTCLEVLWTGLTGGQTWKQQVWWGRCFGFVGKGTLGVNLFYLPLHV